MDLKDYVINYIEDKISNLSDYAYSNTDDFREVNYLESLSDKEIKRITNSVENDKELTQKINELIDYYIYHK